MALGGSLAGTAKVVLTADTANFDRGMRDSQRSFHSGVNTIEKDSDRMGRGVLAASGAFSHLGRSLAFASGAFIGAAGFTSVVRDSIGAAEDLGKAQRGLDAQLRANNEGFAVSSPLIAEVNRQMALFGHTNAESEDALSRLTRATGNFTEATKLMTVTADLAAARHITLSQAALLVGKVADGNVSALNRYGIAIAKGTSVTDALRIAQQKLAGQAAAGVTPQERLHTAVTNLESGIGEALLPSINHVAEALSKWIGTAKNQETVTRDVKNIVADATTAFNGARVAIKAVDGVTGGFKQTLELLLGLKVAFTLSKWATAMNLFTGSEAAGTGVAAARAETGLLNKNLKMLTGFAAKPIQLFIAYEVIKKLTGSGADLSNTAGGAGDLLPVYKNGKWVDPITNKPVADQAYWNKTYNKAGGTGKPATGATAAGDVSGSKQGSIIATARSALGNPYQYGGAPSISSPTDCSGLMVAVFAKNHISLPRTSQEQYAQAPIKNARPLLPGDLVFAEGVHPGHVGLYIGNDQVLEDPHTGDHVKIVALSDFGWNGESARWWGGKANVGAAGGTTDKKWTPPPSTTSAKQTNALPASIRLAVSNADAAAAAASLTPGKKDDKAALAQQRAALNEEIAFLKKALNTNVGAEKRITLTDLLTGAFNSIKGLAPGKSTSSAAAAVAAKVNAGLDKQIGTTSIADETFQIGALKSGTTTQTVNIPGIGKILTQVSLQPTVKAWQQVADDLKKKYAAANDRLKSWNRSLAKAKKAKYPNKAVIAHINQQIAKVKKLMGDIKTDIGVAMSEINQLGIDANDAAQQAADEAESGAADLPLGLQQGLANAQLTGDIGAQMTALKAEDAYLSAQLGSIFVTTDKGTFVLDDQARLNITQALAGIRDQERSLIDQSAAGVGAAATDGGTQSVADAIAAAVVPDTTQIVDALQQRTAFFRSLRDMRGIESNILSNAIGNSTITVNNTFATAPSDPHTFSAGVAFDLQALIG